MREARNALSAFAKDFDLGYRAGLRAGHAEPLPSSVLAEWPIQIVTAEISAIVDEQIRWWRHNGWHHSDAAIAMGLRPGLQWGTAADLDDPPVLAKKAGLTKERHHA